MWIKPTIFGYSKCKNCVKAEQREQNKIDKEKEFKSRTDSEFIKATKCCVRCGKDKSAYLFRINRNHCNDCEKERGRIYNAEHPEIRQRWVDNHPERMCQLQAEWYQKNKIHVQNKYTSRYESDKCFRLKQARRRTLLTHIAKIKSTENYLGAKIDRVADWLESNFTPEMNWQNHGKLWDIDHVIPISRFDLNDPKQVDLCFNWKNLNPLDSKANLSKKDHIDHDQVQNHIVKLKDYCAAKQIQTSEIDEYIDQRLKHISLIGKTP